MESLRRLVLAHRALAGAVIALALALRLLVPTGFMPTAVDGRIVVSLCSGTGPATMVVTIPGLRSGSEDQQHGQAEQPCAFASLAAPFLGATDPVLLALAILFAVAMGRRPLTRLATCAPPHLRPPLRGPPSSV